MHRALHTLAIIGLFCGSAVGQEASVFAPDGSVAAEELTGASSELAANQRNASVFNDVIGLRTSFNAATAEEGSTGLGAAGRIEPVRPFSDRLAAVARTEGGGAALDTSIFAGDTVFDQASGFRIGRFTVLPEVTINGGYTDNVEGAAGGQSGGLFRISPNITATSDWSRHQLDFALRGSYVAYPDSSDDDDPSLTASSALRLDVANETTVNADLAYTYSREDASSAESATGQDDVHQINASLGLTRGAGVVSATISGGIDRNIYSADDGIGSAGGRDNTLYSAGLRLNAETGAAFTPFVEGALLLRRFDQECSDSLCERRDANGYEFRGGFGIDNGPKLAGEIGAGWRVEDLQDDRLGDLSGLVVDASLVWSPSRLTTVTAGLGTSFETTDIDGASGSIIYSGDLRLAYGFSDRLVGEIGTGYSYRTYQGADIDEGTFTGFGGLTYALTKNVALDAQYTYQNFDTTSPGGDYSSNTIEAGVRIRH
ncbi:hypothetical protein JM93_03625 [Roseibium hamelinense]|uniref:Uncharacterized protein n=1 Tax=Roseibium hamelinense TaxID=150831 RepID=A0A562SLT0_9HYPH|nr:outer membrane beta-barrel protein [Roseibium hamelinense]MTI45011.1 hypothetical protein [Roseibium hamelinense]TWI82275.1 hypothetical protein JM93_03625 [Roseibium hamelinense]